MLSQGWLCTVWSNGQRKVDPGMPVTATREVFRQDGLDWISYNEDTRVLEMQFMASAAVYGFVVEPETVQGLRDAPQKNIYFLNHIKPKCRRLPGKG